MYNTIHYCQAQIKNGAIFMHVSRVPHVHSNTSDLHRRSTSTAVLTVSGQDFFDEM